MGKGRRSREKRKTSNGDSRLWDAGWTRTSSRVEVPGVWCPACKGQPFQLCSAVSLMRCDCGWQGFQFIGTKDGRPSHVFIIDEELCPVDFVPGGDLTIHRPFGDCIVRKQDEVLCVLHERGFAAYSPLGHLLVAEGVFVGEHLVAARPPVCQCGSFNVDWLTGTDAVGVVVSAAETMERKVIPHRCMGEMWMEIEDFGGRAARCNDCEATAVFPTLSADEEEWVTNKKAQRQTLFVSYGGPDEDFAHRLVHSLENHGVTTWFFPRDATPGEKLHRVMHQGVNSHDRVLLICSRASLTRPGVENEIERVLEAEAREGGGDRLIPVTLDRYVFDEWTPKHSDVSAQVLSRVVISFEEALEDALQFRQCVDRLVGALERKL